MEDLKKLANEVMEVIDYYNFPEELFIAGYQKKAMESQKQPDLNCPSCGRLWDTSKHNSCECGAIITKK